MGILFWVIMLLWFLFGLYWQQGDIKEGRYGLAGGHLLLFVLLFLLGWKVFGPPLQ